MAFKAYREITGAGLQILRADASLFIFRNREVTIYMLIYVDHIIIASYSDSTVNKLMQQLTGEFAIKDLGTLNYFLGIEVKQQRDGLILSQKHYALDLLKIACMEKCRAISASMATTERLSREQGHSLNNEEQFRYRSTVGGLQYLTMTRHDLAFAVNRVSQFIQNPTDIPWSAVKLILRYVKGTVGFGLKI